MILVGGLETTTVLLWNDCTKQIQYWERTVQTVGLSCGQNTFTALRAEARFSLELGGQHAQNSTKACMLRSAAVATDSAWNPGSPYEAPLDITSV